MSDTVLRFYKGYVQECLEKLGANFSLVDPEIADWARQYGLGHIHHFQDVLSQVQKIRDADKDTRLILDVGAVPGHLTVMLKHAGYDVHAVDINPSRAKGVFESMQIPHFKVDIESEALLFEDDSYDAILFCEILEHMRANPLRALKEIRRVLKRGGTLLLSTPNITPYMRWRFLWGEDYVDDPVVEFTKLDTIGHMGHFRLYSRKEVIRLLKHVGFNIIEYNTGGRLKTPDRRIDARIFRKLAPNKMRIQLYIRAMK